MAGAPYDTLEEVIGLRGSPKHGSLKEFGVSYRELPIRFQVPGPGVFLWLLLIIGMRIRKLEMQPDFMVSATSILESCLNGSAYVWTYMYVLSDTLISAGSFRKMEVLIGKDLRLL